MICDKALPNCIMLLNQVLPFCLLYCLTVMAMISYILLVILPFQVNNLLQIAQKYQSTAADSGPNGVSNNDAQSICSM